MPVLVTKKKGLRAFSIPKTRKQVEKMMEAVGLPSKAVVSVFLVDDDEMAFLNRRYFRRPGPTDVIAFPSGENPSGPAEEILGDIVISLETALRQAKEAGWTFSEETDLLLCHGLLHLLGMTDSEERKRMEMELAAREILDLIRRKGRKIRQSGTSVYTGEKRGENKKRRA